MDLILLAIAALVGLAGVDAALWPRTVPMPQRRAYVVRPSRRGPTRTAHRRRTATGPALGHARPSSGLCLAPRWWWE